MEEDLFFKREGAAMRKLGCIAVGWFLLSASSFAGDSQDGKVLLFQRLADNSTQFYHVLDSGDFQTRMSWTRENETPQEPADLEKPQFNITWSQQSESNNFRMDLDEDVVVLDADSNPGTRSVNQIYLKNGEELYIYQGGNKSLGIYNADDTGKFEKKVTSLSHEVKTSLCSSIISEDFHPKEWINGAGTAPFDFEITERTLPGQDHECMVLSCLPKGNPSGQIQKAEFLIDPDLGYSVVASTLFGRDGKVIQKVACSEFKPSDRHPAGYYPQRVVRESFEGDSVARRTTYTISQFEIGITFDEKTFTPELLTAEIDPASIVDHRQEPPKVIKRPAGEIQ